MAAEVRMIGGAELQVGQWVQFFTNQNLDAAPIKQRNIYQSDQRFLIISREDDVFDACRCFLVDVAGERYDYCPRMKSLGRTELVWEGEIRAVSRNSVESIHGIEKVTSVYEAAQNTLRGYQAILQNFQQRF